MDIEIRRIKTKLKLFEEEGFNWVLLDLADEIVFRLGEPPLGMPERIRAIKAIKKRYQIELEALSPPEIKQGKLEL